MRRIQSLGIFLGIALFAVPGHAATPPGDATTLPQGAAAPAARHLDGHKSHHSAARRHRHRARTQVGLASWYGRAWHGRRTASGERFDSEEMTAAHRSLPLQSRALVTNMANGRSVAVRITDRGPHAHGRIIDVSHSAAVQLGMLKTGVAHVKVEPLPPIQTAEAP
ncbi:MAG TPA: septal ring lytic transglycosylase RlpA family protein [Stellaceae bacterium]|nr:septal ring lytic transglycosylase RlpA family protein [Stellaceae bacterium]